MKKNDSGEHVRLGRVGDRPFWILNLSVFIRAAHQVGAAIFLASFIFDQITLPASYLVLTIVSGVALMCTESMRHRQLYREFAGLSTIVKLVLIGAAYHGFLPEVLAVTTAFFLASVGSHMPKIIRHRLII